MVYRMKKILFAFLPLFISVSLFAQNSEEEIPGLKINAELSAEPDEVLEEKSVQPSPTFKNGLIAAAETIGSNVLLANFNRFILKADYAQISPESVYDNLTHCWVWDNDEFVVNQLGHPYQGSFYFAAGRANNFNFYESLGYAALGSVTWEYFAETERQSVNDLICTTFGGAAFGEVFHRLYIEASGEKSILAFIISPMDALNALVTENHHTRDTKEGVTSFENFLSMGGIAERTYSAENSYNNEENVNGNLHGGFSLIYGNPFRNEKSIPFSYFNFKLDGGGTVKYYQVKTNIEGSLYRFGTKYSEKSSFSALLGMTFKVDWTKLSSCSVNGLGIILNSSTQFKNNFVIDQKLNLSGTFFATGDCYSLYRGYVSLPNDGIERRLYDYGAGFYSRYEITARQNYFGKLNLNIACLGFFDIETAVPSYAEKGETYITETSLSYDHLIKKHISLGIKGSYYFKYENNYGAENVSEHIISTDLYLARKIK